MFTKPYASLLAAVCAAALSLSSADAATTTGKHQGTKQVIPLAQVPKNVRHRIHAEAKGRKIVKVERITKGETVTYEAFINGKRSHEEVYFSSHGSVIKRETTKGHR
jgi:hypothetical protein